MLTLEAGDMWLILEPEDSGYGGIHGNPSTHHVGMDPWDFLVSQPGQIDESQATERPLLKIKNNK